MPDELRVLLVEDDPNDARLIEDALAEFSEASFHPEHVTLLADAIRRAGEATFDAILLDLGLPDSEGLATLAWIRASVKDIPIVVITSDDDEIQGLKALQWGASDYLVKGQIFGTMLGRSVAASIDRSRAERATRLSEERMRTQAKLLDAVLHTSPLAIVLLDREHKVQLWNHAAEKMFGWPADEVIGTVYPLIGPVEGADFAEVFAEAWDGRVFEGVELSRRTRDGRVLDVNLWNAQLRDEEGEVIGLIGVLADLTSRRTLEEQLRHAQKMEAVGRLAGGIAHDFNNVLTVIGGNAQLLLAALEADDPNRIDVEEIESGVQRAATLTRQLLAFSRRQVLQPKVLDLRNLIRDLERMVTRLVGEDVEVRTSYKSESSTVVADPGQLEQVLMNLVVNARDAMPDGGLIAIRLDDVEMEESYISDEGEMPAGSYVRITVSDDGTGIPADVLPHIFEPFFTTKDTGHGTGLGLSMVYGMIKQSGGFIWVYSEPGHGATFKIMLPRHDHARSSVAIDHRVADRVTVTETVLLVEDEASVRSLVRRALTNEGYRVFEAADGMEALRLAREYAGPIHLLLTDVVMPGMGGRDLADALAATRPDTRVLYMSGYTEDVVLHHGIRDETAAFLEKPFTAFALNRAVRQVLETSTPPD
jgi:PAS domain S-box-containing protein